jgi:hypothetical protein
MMDMQLAIESVQFSENSCKRISRVQVGFCGSTRGHMGQGRHRMSTGVYYLYGTGNGSHQLWTAFYEHKGNIPAAKSGMVLLF